MRFVMTVLVVVRLRRCMLAPPSRLWLLKELLWVTCRLLMRASAVAKSFGLSSVLTLVQFVCMKCTWLCLWLIIRCNVIDRIWFVDSCGTIPPYSIGEILQLHRWLRTWWALRVLMRLPLRLWALVSVCRTVLWATLRKITCPIGIPGPRILNKR